MIEYKKHHLSKIVAVQEIESADYVRGVRPSTHSHVHQEAWELCVCLEGETVIFCDQKKYILSVNQMLFIQPGKLHDVSVYREDSSAFVISFTCSNGINLVPLQGARIRAEENLISFFQKMIVELELAFERKDKMLHLFQFVPSDDSPLGAEQIICCYLELALISILRNITMDEEGTVVCTNRFSEAMNTYLSDQITSYIDEHLGERLTVDAIAKHFHYSRARLSTIYKNITGLGIHETIDEKRIKQAKMLLRNKELSISEISDILGFSSSTYFTHKFTKTVGMSPTKFAATVSAEE